MDLVRFGICEALIPFMGALARTFHGRQTSGFQDTLNIINFINKYPECVPRLIAAGLPQALVQIIGDIASTKNFSHGFMGTLNIIDFLNKSSECVPKFISAGLSQVLVQTMGALVSTKKDYSLSRELIEVLKIVNFINQSPEYIPIFVADGLLQVVVQIFHSTYFQDSSVSSDQSFYKKVIKDLCNHDSNIGLKFVELGVPKKSKKKCFMTYMKGIAKGP
jgi:hypothetical protein